MDEHSPEAAGPLRARPAAGDVLVIGCGMAGAATATALAERGRQVVVIGAPAVAAASSVPLALMAPYPTRARDPLTRLRNRGLATTRAWLTRLEHAGLDSGRRRDGVLLIPARPRDRQRRDRFVESEWARRVSPDEARARTGATPAEPAVLHAGGACVDPTVFGDALMGAGGPRIRRLQAHVVALERHGSRWQALDADGDCVAEAGSVVIAAGIGSKQFSSLAAERLAPVRGQATAFAATPETRVLRCPVSHGGYILPATDDVHWVGATATRDDIDCRPRESDDRANAQRLLELWPEIDWPRAVDRFVAIRATTGNRLPLIGAIGDGMWLNTGHGSHGLLTAPLAGRMIARAIVRGHGGRMALELRSMKKRHQLPPGPPRLDHPIRRRG